MTVFPEMPHLETAEIVDGREIRRLKEDHATVINCCLGWSILIVVKAGYETDGATVSLDSSSGDIAEQVTSLIKKYFPSESVISVYNRLVGTPWDMPRLLAAIPHDALYSRKWKCRFFCDRIYRKILKNTQYDVLRREIEYDVIRLLGWRSWNAVTKEEKSAAKSLVVVKLVRTNSIPVLLERLRIE